MKLLVAFTAFVFSFPNLPAAQQTSPVASSTQATILLGKSLAALTGQSVPSDDLSLSSGQRSEVCDLSATTPAGTWSPPRTTNHGIAFEN